MCANNVVQYVRYANMDFDPKCLFEDPPRMKEDLKQHMRKISDRIIRKILMFASILFEDERLTESHVQTIILAMSFEPITVYNRQGLCIENNKLKSVHKILVKDIENMTTACETTDKKYGGLDKKMVKSCTRHVKSLHSKISSKGILAIACVVIKICGILLESCMSNSDGVKTLTLELFMKESVHHKANSGNVYPYSSMMRFLHVANHFQPTSQALPGKVRQEKKYDKNILEGKVSFV